MQWVKVNTNTPSETFELWHDNKKVASTSFNSNSHIIRMAGNAGKRLFFYGKKGWFSKKPVIQNEYGITLGKLETQTETGEKGMVELDGKIYHYQLNSDETISLELFDDGQTPGITTFCSFGNVLSKGLTKTKKLMNSRFPQLLLLLCWYSLNMHHQAGNQQATPLPY